MKRKLLRKILIGLIAFSVITVVLMLTFQTGTTVHLSEPTGEPFLGFEINKARLKQSSGSNDGIYIGPHPLLLLPIMIVGKIVTYIDVPISYVAGTLLFPQDATIREKNQSWCRVVDLEGNPISGAEMYVGIIYPGHRRGYLLTSDENGFFEYSFHTPSADITFLGARGHYSWRSHHSINEVDQNFSSNREEVSNIKLAPIRNPVDNEVISITVDLPSDLRSLDIDLLKEEAMPPYGNGKHADLRVHWILQERKNTFGNNRILDVKIQTITALLENDGFQHEISEDESEIQNSKLGPPTYTFPVDGYLRSLDLSNYPYPYWNVVGRIRSESTETIQYLALSRIRGAYHKANKNRGDDVDFIRLFVSAGHPPQGSLSREYTGNSDLKTWERRDARKERLKALEQSKN
jgi:hypothetical protein